MSSCYLQRLNLSIKIWASFDAALQILIFSNNPEKRSCRVVFSSHLEMLISEILNNDLWVKVSRFEIGEALKWL